MNRRLLPVLLAALVATSPVVLSPTAPAQDKGGEKKGEKSGEKSGEESGEKEGRPKKDGDGAKGKKRERLDEGDEVKDLSLDLVEGGSWTASGARGKVVVLVFAGSWSTESIDALKKLGDPKGKLAGKGAELLGVLRDATTAAAKKVAGDKDLKAVLAVDPKRKAYDRLAKSGLPYTVVLDREGKIALSESGFDDERIAKKVEALAKRP